MDTSYEEDNNMTNLWKDASWAQGTTDPTGSISKSSIKSDIRMQLMAFAKTERHKCHLAAGGEVSLKMRPVHVKNNLQI